VADLKSAHLSRPGRNSATARSKIIEGRMAYCENKAEDISAIGYDERKVFASPERLPARPLKTAA
jgi:hypothetical protein